MNKLIAFNSFNLYKNMKSFLRIILVFIIVTYSNNIYSQKKTTIEGKISNKVEKDTILFVPGMLDKKYYEVSEISAEVIDNKFRIKQSFFYPQRYFLAWKSERNNVPFHSESFFLDNSTKTITVGSKNETVGNSSLEFTKKFIPYMLKGTSIGDIETYEYEHGLEFDSKLLSYIKQNPDSYVALWFLIERFDGNGYSAIYDDAMGLFSNKIKTGKLWGIISKEIKNIRIRQNEKFPQLVLKDIDLKSDKIILSEQKIVLIDFWFSRCKPCLAQLPKLKEIYERFASTNKFEIIGISTDKTVNIDLWKKRVSENQLKWKNYLDENAFESNKEKIRSFPTNFLVDANGVVIKKNISLLDLEEFLNKNLK